MESVKKRRAVFRGAFTRVAGQLENLLGTENCDENEIEAVFDLLQEKKDSLQTANQEVFTALLEVDATEEDLDKELKECDEYAARFKRLKARMKRIENATTEVSTSTSSTRKVRKFKLPIIEFKKFGGDIKEWLPFWSQFEKVHEDDEIPPEDKFQYLLMAISPNTRASELVNSYPPTAGNYVKVISSLKERFGRSDLLVEFYIRELLKLVVNRGQNKRNLLNLYDKIEAQLRSLETLGITIDTYAAMLYPLVESCLPEDLLRVWQRSADFTTKVDSSLKDRLNKLMSFLKIEVQSEERIALAVEGFSLENNDKPRKYNYKTKILDNNNLPTAAGLLNSGKSKCLFCEGSHLTEKCIKAQKMSLESKKKILTERRACFRCTKIGHLGRRCFEKNKCVLCGGQHVSVMCANLNKTDCAKDTREEIKSNSVEKDSKNLQEEATLANFTNMPVFLQTIRVKLRNETKEREIRAILDSGSQRSYILRSSAREMEYSVKRVEKITHVLFGGGQTTQQKHNCHEIRLASLDGSYFCKFEALDQPVICNQISPIYSGTWTSDLQRANIELTDYSDGPIELLIGSDVLGKLLTGRKLNLECGLTAVHTLLGWVLMGKVPHKRTTSCTNMIVTSLLSKDTSITELWQLDVLGILDPGEKLSRIELEEATKRIFEETITKDNEGRYEVGLPWKENHSALPTNEILAKKRLYSIIKKLESMKCYSEYGEVFREWLREGIIEEVPVEELGMSAHYLPHRPVIKEGSTTKIRPVFDASCRERGKPALNDCLEKGPNLIELIPSLLLKFRADKIGVTADIRKAFLQISLNKNDRNFLRFFWRTKDGVEKVYRHKRVVFGVNASPFLLGATIEHHLKHYLEKYDKNSPNCEQVIEQLSRSFYVDNCVTSLPNEEDLHKFIEESKKIMSSAKFELRGWEYTGKSNCEENSIPLLGLQWNTRRDTLTVNLSCDETHDKISKRTILSTAQRIFDPIGFTSPVTVLPKILLQKLWQEKITWDDEIDEDSEFTFRKWESELHLLSNIEIPRWIEFSYDAHLSLHTFCDASGVAYAAVVYLRVQKEDSTKIYLLQAKSRIAPIKKLTIPRLELLAACIGARLYNNVKGVLGPDIESYFWSDSTTVLSWIRSDEEWSIFVHNRVQEIRNLTSINFWRHVPGELNPSDLPSRGCSPKYLVQSKWWEGPRWLKQDIDHWPKEKANLDETKINEERKKKVIMSMLCTETARIYGYFSKYQKIVRMIGWIYRFVYNSKNAKARKKGEISAAEFESAEKILIRLVQQESFQDETDDRLKTLNVFKDKENLLRVKTQVCRRDDHETFRYPYVLPRNHVLVRRLIYDAHVKSCHVGTQILLNILRERFWILGGRRTVRSVISACKACKRYQAKHLETKPVELMLDRVRDASTFEIVGIDLAGPIYTQEAKIWICIFTCAIYRAIHLDITLSASTTDFLKTFRRFVARRGRPRVVYTDNGTNFCGADNMFNQLDWEEIAKFSSAQRIMWRFNPPSAPWWGGWWERIIGMLKKLLRRTLGRARLTNDEIYTILCDCEALINSRPLTYMSEESKNLVPLTPAMFLREIEEIGVPECDAIDASAIKRRFRYVQRLRVELRKRFRIEYLGQLNQHNKCKKVDNISVGDIVLIGNDSAKRIDWPLARVVELLNGKDGNIRVVKLQTGNGFLVRPLQRLYLLEAAESTMAADAVGEETTCSAPADPMLQSCSSQDSDVQCCDSESESGDVRGVSRYGRKIKKPEKIDL